MNTNQTMKYTSSAINNKCLAAILAVAMTIAAASISAAAENIKLPPPQTDGGIPLMQALKHRSTARAFSPKELPAQTLSNLLWAAFGVNRPDSGKRTAPSAMNWQEIDIYVALPGGLYLYAAETHSLAPVLDEDIRAATGMQQLVKDAPVNLVFVADFAKMKQGTKDDKILYSAADTGFISQNVYLFCASEGLATFVRGFVDKPALSKIMRLRKDQKITLAQSVGFPAEE